MILDYGLSKAALAVYPVLCCEADFEKDEAFQISQKNIARFAGVSENSVRNALKELENAGLLIKEKVTDGPRHFYIYRVGFFCKPILTRPDSMEEQSISIPASLKMGYGPAFLWEPRPSIYS